ncbi:MAG: PAS domain S-box protein [Candidatus Tectomicrobia bacterium]|uniref:histidine kinase n=1 Tax=Tectimicrobiota bacterium TaxID=2528274 RepID=A0A937W4H6_UNCTE|nr:PAS domain S-box protein [Candidatus Tectomicrobia bacterium]
MMSEASPREQRIPPSSALVPPQMPQLSGSQHVVPGIPGGHRCLQAGLQPSGIRAHDLLSASLQGMCVLQGDGLIRFINPLLVSLLGYTHADELHGHAFSTLLAPHEQGRWEEYRRACAQETYAPQRHTMQALRYDKQAIWLELLVAPTFWQGAPAVLVACLDVTERHHLEAQIRQHHKMHALGTLAGGIAHDFNNMLAAILGYTELVMDDVPRDSLSWNRLQRVLTAGERAKELVRQILTMSRQQEQERRPLQLRGLIEEVLQLLRASLPMTIAIHQQLATDVGTILADPTQMYQVLMNLCVNAEHAMRLTGGVLER